MAFNYLSGVTTPGAPDSIVNWFATFEAWITGTVGWIVASGSGTTNLVIRSTGEAGGLTKLYVRIWRGSGATINYVYMECRNDAVGTRVTTNDGYVDSGGVQFAYFMAADKDAISIHWKTAAGYRWKYAGLVWPFALTIPDETYQMISANLINGAAAILRNQAGLWDQDATLTDHPYLDDALRDRFDNSMSLIGVYYNTGLNIAGQLKHVGGEIGDGAVNPEDTVTTGFAPATTTWIALTDQTPVKFPVRTGGVLPTGFPDGAHFTHQSGVAPDLNTFLTNIIPTFLTGIGWTNHGEQGWINCSVSRLFSSPGEAGIDQIFIGYGYQPAINTGLYGDVQDNLARTHCIYADRLALVAGDFPLNYWLTADRDCFLLTFQRGVEYNAMWMGMVQAFAPGLYAPGLTPYKMVLLIRVGVGGAAGMRLLREHDGTWGPGTSGHVLIHTLEEWTSNPNAYDGTTYHLWPSVGAALVGADYEPIGVLRYYFGTKGGGIANLDTITVGARVYTIFFTSATVTPWAMRTV